MRKFYSYEGDTDKVRILPEIILHLNECAEIEEVKEIIEYTPESIKLSLGKINISFCGSSLEIASLSSERLSVRGRIISVSFST